ncbi:Inner membrane protein YhaI [compost metagenome]
MFKNPFSFEGRIHRLEYGLSYLICILIYFAVQVFIGFIIGLLLLREVPVKTLLFLSLLPAIYFLIAQGAKRCHDRGNSGWWQLIPFYGFVMMFGEGDAFENEYGQCPKNPVTDIVDPFAVKTVSDKD